VKRCEEMIRKVNKETISDWFVQMDMVNDVVVRFNCWTIELEGSSLMQSMSQREGALHEIVWKFNVTVRIHVNKCTSRVSIAGVSGSMSCKKAWRGVKKYAKMKNEQMVVST
jgi:hypothetical protein